MYLENKIVFKPTRERERERERDFQTPMKLFRLSARVRIYTEEY